jgi:ABC-type phosphate/phosphonate transport system substrate-binding protein
MTNAGSGFVVPGLSRNDRVDSSDGCKIGWTAVLSGLETGLATPDPLQSSKSGCKKDTPPQNQGSSRYSSTAIAHSESGINLKLQDRLRPVPGSASLWGNKKAAGVENSTSASNGPLLGVLPPNGTHQIPELRVWLLPDACSVLAPYEQVPVASEHDGRG